MLFKLNFLVLYKTINVCLKKWFEFIILQTKQLMSEFSYFYTFK